MLATTIYRTVKQWPADDDDVNDDVAGEARRDPSDPAGFDEPGESADDVQRADCERHPELYIG